MKAAPALTLLLAACAPTLVEPLPPPAPVGQTVVRAGERYWAVNPEDGALVAWRRGEAPSRWPIGRSPAALVALGDRAFVSLRGERAVAELDLSGARPRVVARVTVGPEPLGIALTPDGRRLYVAVSLGDEVVAIDVARRIVETRYPVPGQPRGVAVHPSGARVFVTTQRSGAWVVTPRDGAAESLRLVSLFGGGTALRLSGDPAVSPDGRALMLPTVEGTRLDRLVSDGGVWINGYLTEVALDPADGAPGPDGTAAWPAFGEVLRSVAFSPSGELMFAAGAAGAPLTVYASPSVRRAIESTDLRWTPVPTRAAGVTGIAFDGEGGAVLATDIDRGLVHLELAELDVLSTPEARPDPEVARWVSWSTGLAELQERGRRLFHDASDRDVTDGRGTCVTCHVDGRTDGVSWAIDGTVLQTPTLSEGVRAHLPLGWRADQPDADDSARAMVLRLGGRGLAAGELRALQAYVDTLEPADLPARGARTPEAERGRALFEARGCARCHAGPAYTDRALHALGARPAVATPSLRGVAATAPYLVDGSVPALDVLVAEHGGAEALSADDAAALVGFLRTL